MFACVLFAAMDHGARLILDTGKQIAQTIPGQRTS